MPYRPMKPCSEIGCNILTTERHCARHRNIDKKRYDKTRGNFRERGYNSTWDKLRIIKLKQNPLCERCLTMIPQKLTIATLVHHIKNIKDGGELLDMDNLMSLCIKCHDDIHVSQGDKW